MNEWMADREAKCAAEGKRLRLHRFLDYYTLSLAGNSMWHFKSDKNVENIKTRSASDSTNLSLFSSFTPFFNAILWARKKIESFRIFILPFRCLFAIRFYARCVRVYSRCLPRESDRIGSAWQKVRNGQWKEVWRTRSANVVDGKAQSFANHMFHVFFCIFEPTIPSPPFTSFWRFLLFFVSRK